MAGVHAVAAAATAEGAREDLEPAAHLVELLLEGGKPAAQVCNDGFVLDAERAGLGAWTPYLGLSYCHDLVEAVFGPEPLDTASGMIVGSFRASSHSRASVVGKTMPSEARRSTA